MSLQCQVRKAGGRRCRNRALSKEATDGSRLCGLHAMKALRGARLATFTDRRWSLGVIEPSRNPYVTPAMERCLRQMRVEEEDLVHAEGEPFWWVGLTRYHPGTVKALHQLVLVSGELADRQGGLGRFHINEDGHGVLDGVHYVPRIITALRKRRRAR